MRDPGRRLVAILAVLASLAAGPARAQGLRTVVVPSGEGVVVAPRSAPPRMVARPAPPTAPSVAMAPPGPGGLAASSGGLATGVGVPALALLPIIAGAVFAGTLAGNGNGGGTSGPARTR